MRKIILRLIFVWLSLIVVSNALAAAEITPDVLNRIASRMHDDKVPVIIEMADQVRSPAAATGNLAAKKTELLRLLRQKASEHPG